MTRQDFHEQLMALVERGKAVHANAKGFMQTINEQSAATASTEANVQPEATTVVDEQPVVEQPVVEPQATQAAQPTVDAANIANNMDIDALVGTAPDIGTPAQDTAQAAAPAEDANSLVNGVDIDALLNNAPSLQQ